MKILILDSHSNAGLACIQSLGRMGHDVFTASNRSLTLSQSSIYGKKSLIYPEPLKDTDSFITQIINWQNDYSFDFILPITDNTIYPLMTLRGEIKNDVVILPSKKAFEFAFNKEKTLQLAEELGVPVPKNTYLDQVEFDLGDFRNYPFFVKPVQSKGNSANGSFSLEPVLVETEAHLEESVNTFLANTPVQIQECVPGKGIGVVVLVEHGKIIRAFAHQRVHEIPLTGGGSSYRRSIPMPDDLLDYSQRLMGALSWHGVAMVEFKSDGNNHWLMEINGRFWGSLPLAICAGVDFPVLLIDMLSGKSVEEKYRYNENIYVRNITRDIDWFKLNFKADKSNPRLLTRNSCVSLLELFRVFSGRERWDHASLRDRGILYSQISNLISKEFNIIAAKLYKSLTLNYEKFLRPKKVKKAKKILVMCYGNICRSPFVENLLNNELNDNSFSIVSAGFHQKIDRNSPIEYQQLCIDSGIDLKQHRSRLITNELVEWSDIILVMDYSNRALLKNNFGRPALKKCYFLGAFLKRGSIEINDPYGLNKSDSKKIIKHMEDSTKRFILFL